MTAAAILAELEELDRFLTASAARATYGDHICLAAQPETVNGSPEVLVEDGVKAGAKTAAGWGEQIVAALEGKTHEFEIRAAIQQAGARLDISAFARDAEQLIMRGLMLGALDSVWERENDQDIAPTKFAATTPERQFVYAPFSTAVQEFERRKVLPPAAFRALEVGARRRAFTVAGLAKQELLDATHAELLRQLRDAHHEDNRGSNLREFQRFAKERLESAGWTPSNPSHVETIYRTNMASAYSSGRVVEMSQPSVLAALPYWQIRTVKDARQRPTHRAADGIVLPANHPFWLHAYPPFAFNCRCRVCARTKAWINRSGISIGPEPKGLPDPGFESGLKSLIQVPPSMLQPAPSPPKPAAYTPPQQPTLPVQPGDPGAPTALPFNPPPAVPAAIVPVASAVSRGDWSNPETLDLLKQATEELDGEVLRGGLRGAITNVFPTAVTKDKVTTIELNDEKLEKLGALGVHYANSGKVEISSEGRESAAAFFATVKSELGRKKPFYSTGEADAALTLIHEELHGFSRATNRAWQLGPSARKLEEVGTELCAQHVLEKLVPGSVSTTFAGSYHDYIDDVTGVLQKHLDISREQAQRILVENHARMMLAAGPTFESSLEYVLAWAAWLPVTPTQRKAILTEFSEYRGL